MDHVSVIIVNYNTDSLSKACLRSLTRLETKGFNFSIIVVDNGSKIPLRLSKKELQGGLVTLIRSESNLGYAGGNNLGIRQAIQLKNPDYFLLLNNDTTVEKHLLIELYQALQRYPKFGLATPKIYFSPGREFHTDSYTESERGKVIWYAGGSIDWPNLAAFHRGVDELDRGQFNELAEIDFATGCCVLVRRQILETIGLLSETLYLYWEDVEFSLRAKRAGWQLLYVPTAVMWHENSGSSDGPGSSLSVYFQTRNRLWVGWRYAPPVYKLSVLRLIIKYLQGTAPEQRAVLDFVINRMGKQVVV